jgi:hypothetical protein
MPDERKAKLTLIMETTGAKRVGEDLGSVQKSAVTLQSELTKIGRADAIDDLATKYGQVALKTKDATKAAAELNAELKRINATENEISGAASTFNAAQQGGGKNALARLGSEIRQLPSQRVSIAGTEIGTDSLGNFARLAGAAQEAFKYFPRTLKDAGLAVGILKQAQDAATVAETAKTAATIASTTATETRAAADTALAVTEGAATAGAISLNIALAPVAAIGLAAAAAIAAVAAALSVAQAQTAEQTKKIAEGFEAKATVDEFVRSGATTEDALKRLAELQGIVTDATNLRSEAEAKAAEDFKNRTGGPFGEFAARLGDVLNIKSLDEGFRPAIESTTQAIAEATPELEELKLGLESGAFAANDAAVAEEKLKAARIEGALTAADSAGRALAAEQRALASSEEANKARLKSIEDERAVIQAQLDSLAASGVVGEDVEKKIAALNETLGLLGQESSFISSTALEVSRARDAEKQAAADQKKAFEENARAAEQSAKAVSSAKLAYKQSAEDIGTRLSQTLVDNTTKLNRDLGTLSTKFANDEFDLSLKAYRAERNAYQDQLDDLADIRKDAAKSEKQAIQEGNFKDLFLSREAGADALQQEVLEEERARQKRSQSQEDALQDLTRSDQRQRDARQLGYRYAQDEARLAQDRSLQQAQLTQNRALALAAGGMGRELQMRQQFWNATVAQAANALNQINGMQAKAAGASANSPFGAFQSQFKAIVQK